MSFLGNLLRLSPFLATTAYYMLEWVDKEGVYPHYTIFKTAPTACLCLFVLLLNRNSSYSNRIFTALVLSTVGDAVLCYPHLSMYGVLIFGIAQLIYIDTFGFYNKRYDLGLLILIAYVGVVYYLHPFLIKVDEKLAYGVEIYLSLLFTMIWRALARFGLLNFDSFTSLCGSLGPLLFAASDLILFYHISVASVPNGNFFIMLTYYAAQAGIALTTLKLKLN